jgi:O-methyltransferase
MSRLNDPAVGLYLDLMKRCLTRTSFHERFREVIYRRGSVQRLLMTPFQSILRLKGYTLCTQNNVSIEVRAAGEDWPADAETMIGLQRLENIQACVADVIERGVPGDVIETGVWRGGACIFMRAILKAYGETGRTVWVADSFEGVPKPDPDKYAADAVEERTEAFYKFDQLAVSEEQVRENFARYGLLDAQVRFLKGWFRDSLPTIPATQRFAVIRLDGDLYESTWDALTGLYPKLSPGGYCLIDDYGGIPACRNAVEDYRSREGIREPVQAVDRTGVFWQKAE